MSSMGRGVTGHAPSIRPDLEKCDAVTKLDYKALAVAKAHVVFLLFVSQISGDGQNLRLGAATLLIVIS